MVYTGTILCFGEGGIFLTEWSVRKNCFYCSICHHIIQDLVFSVKFKFRKPLVIKICILNRISCDTHKFPFKPIYFLGSMLPQYMALSVRFVRFVCQKKICVSVCWVTLWVRPPPSVKICVSVRWVTLWVRPPPSVFQFIGSLHVAMRHFLVR